MLKVAALHEDVLQTHQSCSRAFILGRDRTAPKPLQKRHRERGNYNLFSQPEDSRRTADMAFGMAADRETMRTKPGEIMGLLAYAHPFLDGNGRTVMTVHADLCRRAGMSIDWSLTNKLITLNALTRELEAPGQGASR
ncbi:Fic family protein [Phyllobacterium salinisoli]|nr:Fic family protein [Phyllobacterium salinisoli]